MSATLNRNIEDDLPIPSFLDPNVRKNRIPTEVELRRYKAFADSNSRIARVLDEEILQLRESYNTIQARYIEQQRELEATQAQLHTAKDILMAVKKQRAALQSQQDSLSALMHPIRHCPEDILRDVFQKVVETTWEISKMKQSVWLSSVCKRWRVITLDSPNLWGPLSLDLKYSHVSQAYFRNTIFPRIKRIPVTLIVTPINSETVPALRICGIEEFPNIRQVRLNLSSSSPENLRILTGADFRPPTGVVHALVLSSKSSLPALDMWSPQQVNIVKVLARFPLVEDLKIRKIHNMGFQAVSAIRNVKKLVLSAVQEVKILDVFRAFPKLEHLELREADLRVDLTGDGNRPVLLVPSVQSLSLDLTTGESWMSHVFLANLHTLVYRNIYSDGVVAFISAHRSITRLDCRSATGITPSMVTAAPQLIELIISPPAAGIICGDTDENAEPPFPLLESVIIIPTREGELTLREFDRLVCSRCLPMRHPKSRAQQASHILFYFSISGTYPSPEWRESEFYKSSTRTVHIRDTKVERLTWPDWA